MPDGSAALSGARSSGAAGSSAAGRYTFTEVPCPASLYTQMLPPFCLTMP